MQGASSIGGAGGWCAVHRVRQHTRMESTMAATLAPGESREVAPPGRTVTLKTPLKTRAGSVLADAGTYDIVAATEFMGYDGKVSRSLTIRSTSYYATPDGIMSVLFTPRKTDKIA